MFYPKPGDVIVTKSAGNFICVGYEDYFGKTFYSDHAIFGHRDLLDIMKGHMCWQTNSGKVVGGSEYDIVKIIPKELADEKQYSVSTIIAALEALEIQHTGEEDLSEMLEKVFDPDYNTYLQLKKKFEGNK